MKSAFGPIVAHRTRPYPGFCSMKRLGVFLLPPGWVACTSQGYPVRRYPFIHLGGERHRESKLSCPKTPTMSPARVPTRTARSGVERTNHEATTSRRPLECLLIAGFVQQYGLLLYLLVSTRALIGKFSGPHYPVRPAKI